MRTVALCLALTVSGCALATSKGPDLPVRADRRPDCNNGKGAAFADGAGGTVLGVIGLGLMVGDEPGPGLLFGLASAAFIGSAVSGSRSADRCRQAMAEYDGLLAMRQRDADTAALAAARTQAREELREATEDDQAPPPVEPTPRGVPPRPGVAPTPLPTPTPTPAARPTPTPAPAPAPTPTPTPDADGDADDDDTDAATGDVPDWREFWREVRR